MSASAKCEEQEQDAAVTAWIKAASAWRAQTRAPLATALCEFAAWLKSGPIEQKLHEIGIKRTATPLSNLMLEVWDEPPKRGSQPSVPHGLKIHVRQRVYTEETLRADITLEVSSTPVKNKTGSVWSFPLCTVTTPSPHQESEDDDPSTEPTTPSANYIIEWHCCPEAPTDAEWHKLAIEEEDVTNWYMFLCLDGLSDDVIAEAAREFVNYGENMHRLTTESEFSKNFPAMEFFLNAWNDSGDVALWPRCDHADLNAWQEAFRSAIKNA